ncbi:MAG TPA: TIGR04013 family B12-binding domain/radical SAM domain-containing protein [Polyangiaceae bacterium]
MLVAYSVRSGIAALNCVAGAVPDDVPVRFVKTREQLVAAVREANATGRRPVVAWSFYSVDVDAAAADLAAVRPATEGALHVAGGVHATAEPLATLRAGFDLVAVGEGETTIRATFEALARGDDPRSLQGIAHLDARGGLVSHGPGERRPLDDFPSFRHGRWQAIEITRGCVYACAFCQTPYVFKARFRHRSVESVRRHVEAMAREGSRFVRFLTPTALSYGSDDESPRLEAVEALLRTARQAAGPGARVYFGTFPSEVRPEHVSREALAIIRRWADNDAIVIGAQSGSERVLESMRRGHGVAEVERAVRLTREAGLRPEVDLLLGFPGETRADREASLQLAERLVAMGARIHSHAMLPLPGTPMRDAVPEPIEDEVATRLARLEARGAAWGAWRRQVIAGEQLVRRRRASVS